MKFFSKLSVKSFSIILVSFIAVATLIGVYLFYNNPKIKFMRLIEHEYKSFVTTVNKAANSELVTMSEGNNLSLTGNVTFNFSLSEDIFGDSASALEEIVNGLNVNYEYASDKDGVNTYLKLDSNLSNKDLIGIEEYQMGDKRYTYYNDIFDKYIENDSISYINKNSNQTKDLEYLTNKIKSSFFSKIESSDFKTSNEKITINKESIDASKITFTLTEERFKEIYKAVLTDIRDDKECIEILTELNSGEDVKSSINELIDSVDKDVSLDDNLVIDMYTKDNVIREVDMFRGNVKFLQYLNYGNNGSARQLTFIDETGNFDIKLEQISPNDTSCTITVGEDVIFGANVANITNSSIENKTWSNTLTIASTLAIADTKMGSITITINTTANVGGTVKTINPNNVVKESDLTTGERDLIASKMLEKISSALPDSLKENNTLTDTQQVY
jgi:hypothetical protein